MYMLVPLGSKSIPVAVAPRFKVFLNTFVEISHIIKIGIVGYGCVNITISDILQRQFNAICFVVINHNVTHNLQRQNIRRVIRAHGFDIDQCRHGGEVQRALGDHCRSQGA